jgi:acyl carrier protein
MDIEEVEKSLIKFLENNILGDEVAIDAKSSLAEIGVDSYSIVEILLFIERKYGFVIPDDYLKPENFNTVNSIAKTVMQVSKDVN